MQKKKPISQELKGSSTEIKSTKTANTETNTKVREVVPVNPNPYTFLRVPVNAINPYGGGISDPKWHMLFNTIIEQGYEVISATQGSRDKITMVFKYNASAN